VASTLHQCLKYYNGGKRKINGNTRLYTDSKFIEEDFALKEMMMMMISIISSTSKGDSKAIKNTLVAMGHNAAKQQQPYTQDDQQVDEVQSIKQVDKQVAVSTHSRALIWRYVP